VTATGATDSTDSTTAPRLLRGDFLAWVLAATASAVGDGILFFAVAWTASGLGASVVTVVLSARLLPEVLLTLVGGAAADRWGLRRTVIGCQVALCALLAGYLLATRTVASAGPLLVGLAMGDGLVSAFHRPATSALPRLFFDDDMVSRALALTGTLLSVARLVGPALGAVVVSAVGMTGAVVADLASFTLVLAVLVAVRPPYERTPEKGTGSAFRQVGAGLREAGRIPGVAALLGAVGLVAGSLLPMLTLCVPLLVRDRGWGAQSAGLIESCWIAGALSVSILVTRMGTATRPVSALALGPVVAGLGVAGVVLAPSASIALVGAAVMGMGTTAFTAHAFPLYLLKTPDGMLARFQSLLLLVQTLPMFVGNNALGWMAGQRGAESAMLAAALACASAGVIASLSPVLRRART
jgi:MFS family permease